MDIRSLMKGLSEEAEISKLLLHALSSDLLDEEGTVNKIVLHKFLRKKLQEKQVADLDPNKLTITLLRHKLLVHNAKDPDTYKFVPTKLLPLRQKVDSEVLRQREDNLKRLRHENRSSFQQHWKKYASQRNLLSPNKSHLRLAASMNQLSLLSSRTQSELSLATSISNSCDSEDKTKKQRERLEMTKLVIKAMEKKDEKGLVEKDVMGGLLREGKRNGHFRKIASKKLGNLLFEFDLVLPCRNEPKSYRLNVAKINELIIKEKVDIMHLLGMARERFDIEAKIKRDDLLSFLTTAHKNMILLYLDTDERELKKSLKRHDLLDLTLKEDEYYKIKMDKCWNIIAHLLIDLEYATYLKNFLTLNHKQTIQQPKNCKIIDILKEEKHICLLCSTEVPDLKDHLAKIHETKPEIEKNLFSKFHEKLFDISYNVEDPLHYTMVTITLINITETDLKVRHIQMMSLEKGLVPLNLNFPRTLQPDEELSFTLTRQFFCSPQRYELVINIDAEVDIIEHHEIVVQKYAQAVSVGKRAKKRADSTIVISKTELPQFEPDHGILKLFQPEQFKLKKKLDVAFTDNELVKYTKLIDEDITRQNYKERLRLFVEFEDLCQSRVLNYFEISVGPNQVEKLVIPEQCKTWQQYYSLNLVKFKDIPDVVKEGDFIVFKEKSIKNCLINTEDGIAFKIEKRDSDIDFYTDDEEIPMLDLTKKYIVSFRKDRFCIRIEQQAIQKVQEELIEMSIFPRNYIGLTVNKVFRPNMKLYNPTISKNSEQLQAVENIVNCSAHPAPYILFGPPGTGKTATLVETVCQIWKLKPEARILITAPSNFACDEIASRLLNYLPHEDIFRVYSKSALHKVHNNESLRSISNHWNNNHSPPSALELTKYRINIMTLVMSGAIAIQKLAGEPNSDKPVLEEPLLTFDYIFVDECGNATEPSALIPISSFVTNVPRTNIVLAGDPKQLGPVVQCDVVYYLGLGKSMLERLMDMSLYQPGEGEKYNAKVITKLLQNFRSHEAILKIPNELFYDGQLVPMAPKSIANKALNWTGLPNKNVPLVLHAVRGLTSKNATDFSLWNDKEVELVIKYVKNLLEKGLADCKVQQSDVGVVSPYRLQVIKIKQRLAMEGLDKIEVGSAEQFQGREKMAIILSTVRSNTPNLGFLTDKRRFNVVITRAKALFIIVGNPATLQKDMNWYTLIEYCKEEGMATGFEFELKKPKAKNTISMQEKSAKKIAQELKQLLDSACLNNNNIEIDIL